MEAPFYIEYEMNDGSYKRRTIGGLADHEGGYNEAWEAQRATVGICAWWRVVDAKGTLAIQGPTR
jgi:hypothetical protein